MAAVVVPLVSVAVSVATAGIKIYIETVRNRRESQYDQNLANAVDRIVVENEQRLQQAAFEAVVYELKDQIDSFREYQKQYKNDLTRLIDEAKVFQRTIGVLMKKLSNAMIRDHISLDALRVWAESARFHIQLNTMTSAGTQSSESFQSLVGIHRETAKELCSEYRRSNPQSTYSETHDIEMIIEDATTWVSNPLSVSNDVNTSGAAGPANQEGQAPWTGRFGLTSEEKKMKEELHVQERMTQTWLNDEIELETKLERQRLAEKEEFEVKIEDESRPQKQESNSYKTQKKGDVNREATKKFRLHELALEERLQRKMADVIDEQQEFTEQETEEKIKDIIETYHEYYELYTRFPERLMQDYEQFQRKFRYLLKKVQNSMQIGDDFAHRIKIWMDGGVLDMKMTGYLCTQGEIQRSTGQAAVEQYKQAMADIISYVSYSAVLPPNMDEIFALALSFNDQLREVDREIAGAIVDSPPPPSAIETQLDAKVNLPSSARPECASAEFENLTKSENVSKYSGCDDWAKCGAKPKRLHSQLSSRRHNNRERKQRELIDAEKVHERNWAEDINNGLQRFDAENEHRMELDLARLAEEDDLLFNGRLEHERYLEDERERFYPSHTSILQAGHGERSQIKIKTCRKGEEKLEVLEPIYDERQMNLTDGHQQSRLDQRDVEERLESKMADLKAEQKKLNTQEKEEKLNDLTKTFLCYRKMYCDNTGILTTETMEFQGKFMLQLTRLKNSVQTVDKFMPRP